jgi:hypothetical protein
MTTQDYDALKKQFDAFSLRLDARAREFKECGAFATTHAAFVERLLKGHAAVQARLESAVHRGEAWESTRAEMHRDINALVGDFGHLEELFDAQMMNQR